MQSKNSGKKHSAHSKAEPEAPLSTQTYEDIADLPFPFKLWQTAPDKIVKRADDVRNYQQSWFKQNPLLRHEVVRDASADAYVRDKFAHRPDIVELYTKLPQSLVILKADLFRYLVLIADGGIYADIDVSCDTDITTWFPKTYRDKVTLIIGQEFDYAWRGEGRDLASQFTNWILMAKPGNRHLQMVVDVIVKKFEFISQRHHKSYDKLTLGMLGGMGDANIINTTGPKIMSKVILQSLSLMLNATVDDRNISGVNEPRLLGDVLIMPDVAFAAPQARYRKDGGPQLVSHHYFGTWKHED